MKKENPKVLAIIPARSGSKGVPNKNILNFNGKPLIHYALDCALGTQKIDKILINSDDSEILNLIDDSIDSQRIIKQLRPKHLAEDQSSIVNVVLHAIENLEETFDILFLLQVTSPVRSNIDIEKIINYFEEDTELEGVISVIPVDDNHPARMYNINDKNELSALIETKETKHRQELEKVYLRNGCFYAIRTSAFLKQKTFMPKLKKAYIMNAEHHLNIDSPRDVIIAEALIKAWKEEKL